MDKKESETEGTKRRENKSNTGEFLHPELVNFISIQVLKADSLDTYSQFMHCHFGTRQIFMIRRSDLYGTELTNFHAVKKKLFVF